MYLTARVIVLCLLVFLSLAASADSLTGKVVKITDGDTFYVLDTNYKQHKIRLAGIDAPERKQAYGLASRKHKNLPSIYLLPVQTRHAGNVCFSGFYSILSFLLTKLLHHSEMGLLGRRLERSPSLRHLAESDHDQACGC